MKKVRFYMALICSKLCLLVFKLLGNRQDDRPGGLALRICPDFLQFVAKPKTVICVTGTNGKTTVANLLSTMLIKLNNTVAYNDWGANTKIGVARCLLDAVTFTNKSNKDICVLETDEITSKYIWPYVEPDYIVVTNLFRDSMHRNAHPKYVFDLINEGIIPKSTLILNSDDLISSFLGTDFNKKIYYGIETLDSDLKVSNNIVNDVRICPRCHSKLNYNAVRYNHIGRAKCFNCGFENIKADFLATKVDFDNKKIFIKHDNIETIMPLLSDSVFNAYNVLAVVTCLYTLGYDSDSILGVLKSSSIVKSRYSDGLVNGIVVSTIATKGLNAVATSTVCDYVSKKTGNIELIMVLDDTFDNVDGSEAICWIYDSDFEFLNNDNIKKIVVGGVRSKDYKLRLLLAGIPEDRIICCNDEMDTYKYVDVTDVDYIYIMHEVYFVKKSQELKKLVINRILKESGGKQ